MTIADNNQHPSLAEYLKGALANQHIVNTGTKVNCAECPHPEKNENLLALAAPKVATINSVCNLRLRINNLTGEAFSGTIHLMGTGNIRKRAYEYTAPFALEANENALCLSFQWRAPDYPTHIEWSVTLQGNMQMGMTVAEVSTTSVVKKMNVPQT